MKKSIMLILAAVFGIGLVLGEAPSMYAQEEFTLEEITVTAQKRAEDAQKVPITMEVISGSELTVMGKSNVDDILANISSVMVNYSNDGMRVSVRGITENEPTFGDLHVSTPTVAINIDGAYNNNSTAGQNLFDVERIELLSGPQGTMYASNSPGGILNVVTAAPKTDRHSASGSIELGKYSLLKAQAIVNAPLVKDKIAMRLAYNQEKRDPYITGSSQANENTKVARFKTLWQPNDKLNTTVTLNYTKRINAGMMGGQVRPFDTPDGHWYEQIGGVWVMDGAVTDPWTAPAAGGGPPPPPPGEGGGVNAPMMGPNQADQTSKGITAEINWDTGIGNLSAVPQYTKTTSDDQGQYEDAGYTWMVYTHMDDSQKGIEARMTSAEDFIFKWIAGYNYFKYDSKRATTYNEPGATSRVNTMKEERRAIFTDITYPFTDRFRGTAGYRWSRDKMGLVENPPTKKTGFYQQDYSSPNYKLGVEYDLAADSMLYATYANSYRVMAMALDQGPQTLQPERLNAYTVGTKNRFLENRLQLNAAAFYYDYKNKEAEPGTDGRISSDMVVYEDDLVDPYGEPVDATGNGTPGEHVLLTGATGEDPWLKQSGTFRSIGMDVSADWLITDKDRVNLGISYLDAKWTELLMVYYWQKASGGHFWPTDGKNYSGRTNVYSPTWTLNGGYEHNFVLGTFGTLLPRIDLQYRSDYVLDYQEVNYPLNHQEPYYLIDASATFTSTSDKWSINAYIKNATNYAAKNFFMGMGGAALGITNPRTFGAVLSVRF